MVYYGGTDRARRISSLVVRDSGGGPKKAGFPYEIGRTDWSSIYIERQPLSKYQTNILMWDPKPSRPQWVAPRNYAP
jgi:hypothetical protein